MAGWGEVRLLPWREWGFGLNRQARVAVHVPVPPGGAARLVYGASGPSQGTRQPHDELWWRNQRDVYLVGENGASLRHHFKGGKRPRSVFVADITMDMGEHLPTSAGLNSQNQFTVHVPGRVAKLGFFVVETCDGVVVNRNKRTVFHLSPHCQDEDLHRK